MKNLDNKQIIACAAEKLKQHSPFLTRLLEIYPDIVADFVEYGADILCERIIGDMRESAKGANEQKEIMKILRVSKGKFALFTALADISSIWKLEQITNALSVFAQECLVITIDHLLATALRKGDISHADAQASGIIILAMGKMGAYELNYSSDIDIIIFYESGKLGYKGRNTEQQFMNKLAHELVAIMQDRTSDGYVFRTDLRLRPDPASTPPAITVNAAYHYYESVGQNWERAAMIKARTVAGDIDAGNSFIKSLTPFMWRRNLDFAAINDIHSIKLQVNSRQNKHIRPRGHNIKLGLGGIREIEFFVQIHQLIWGGREPRLRMRSTCDTLGILSEMGLTDKDKENILRKSYYFLRTLEHRIQMVADEQTHTLPENEQEFRNIAEFMGYEDVESFSDELTKHLYAVHEIYKNSFSDSEEKDSIGNLVFTGTGNDAGTLKTLRDMGYNHPEVLLETITSWHHGASRATKTVRARELLTEVIPDLLLHLARTANPDLAFIKFNEFLQRLPAAVQLFSLFKMNPHLLELIADIMGSAPTLAESLSRNPELLDAVLYEDFYKELPDIEELNTQINSELLYAKNSGRLDFEYCMNKLRQFRNEKQFQAGVQLLKNMIDANKAGEFLTDLAECVINFSLKAVCEEFEKTYGTIKDTEFAIIALGKLGGREMTFSSDIDLVFVYDSSSMEMVSDGVKSFNASVYYNRFAQRLLNAITGMTRDGRLYEVDTRLRPSGEQGLLAVNKPAFMKYFDESAWTFEYMAFTKARVIAGGEKLKNELMGFIISQITKPRDAKILADDVENMRNLIEKQYSTNNIWDIKYIRGGLMDIDFIAQYLFLLHAFELKDVTTVNSHEIFNMLKEKCILPDGVADELISAKHFLEQLFNMLRLCSDSKFDGKTAPEGLKKLLVETVKEKDFDELVERLVSIEKTVYDFYKQIIIGI